MGNPKAEGTDAVPGQPSPTVLPVDSVGKVGLPVRYRDASLGYLCDSLMSTLMSKLEGFNSCDYSRRN